MALLDVGELDAGYGDLQILDDLGLFAESEGDTLEDRAHRDLVLAALTDGDFLAAVSAGVLLGLGAAIMNAVQTLFVR